MENMNLLSRVFTLLFFSLLSTSFLIPCTSQAQELPKKSITMYVGFAAGGGADTSARIIAKKLSENIGQPVIVENRPGAGGNIVHATVAFGPIDGSVILLGSIGPLSIAPHLMKLNYDPVRDLAPLTMGVAFPNILVVGVTAPGRHGLVVDSGYLYFVPEHRDVAVVDPLFDPPLGIGLLDVVVKIPFETDVTKRGVPDVGVFPIVRVFVEGLGHSCVQ
jgi:hypothetical protein